jgi:hypothetical protein
MGTQEASEQRQHERRVHAVAAASNLVAALVSGDHIGPELSDTGLIYNVLTLAATLEAYLDGRITVGVNAEMTMSLLTAYRAQLSDPLR